MDSHKYSTAIDSSLLHQKLVFPCVWMSTKQGTDVPAPPQLSQIPKGVIVRILHERKVVWQSPSIRPDFTGVDQWDTMASTMDICWSIHRRWVKTFSNV